MPNTVATTMRKWAAVRDALMRANRGRLRGTFHVREHNAPTYNAVYKHFNNAFSENLNNHTMGGSNPQTVMIYFMPRENRRMNIAAAYNKLNQMARELAAIRRKAVATSTLQRHWRQARPAIVNKRKMTALMTLTRKPGVPNTRRAMFNRAFPKKVYGPSTEWEHLRSRTKYNRY